LNADKLPLATAILIDAVDDADDIDDDDVDGRLNSTANMPLKVEATTARATKYLYYFF